MARKRIQKVENTLNINNVSEAEAREFLIKGGVLTTKVTNYKPDGEITSYMISEKQISPNLKLHLTPKEIEEVNPFKELKKELGK